MIPMPNLDDRTYEDIVEEAIRLIPQYCPSWTNFNKSDPGITLIELFAWMTEMLLYRLNRVPERNYLAFLNMMGIKLQPPQPARALVQFEISDKIDQARIPAGTRLATKAEGEQGSITFETSEDLLALRNELVRCMSQYEQQFSDNTPYIGGERGPFEVFGGARSIERFIYLGDQRLSAFNEDAILTVRVEAQGAGEREFHELLEWEYWNGTRWRSLARPSMDTDRNTVAFQGPMNFTPTTVNEIEGYWIRGKLFEVPRGEDETVVDTISARLEVLGEGVPPELALCNAEGGLYTTLDVDKNFLPLGKAPQIDSTLYLACDSLLAQPDTTIRIETELSDQTVADNPGPSADLILRWEYFNGKRWKILAKVAYADNKIESDYEFKDETACFSASGVISFLRPRDLAVAEVQSRKHYWIRCRVESGNYGVRGSYELEGDIWVWKDDNPLRPPSLKSLSLKFQEEPHGLEHVLVYNDFVYTEHTAIAAQEYKPWQVFQPVAEESPTLFLGWAAPFPNELCKVYFHVVEEDLGGGRAALRSFDDRTARGYVEQIVVWEYWDGKGWSPLLPNDRTSAFTQAGFVEFVGPKNFRKSRRFGESLYWMRARLEMGGYDSPPKVERVLLNSTYSHNQITYGETILGSSKGTPNQSFYLAQTPVLDGEVIMVLEPDKPKDEEAAIVVDRYGEGAVYQDEEKRGWWIRWSPVESFFDAEPRDRVYVKETSTGEVRFSDGIRGMIPPLGEKNVRCFRYQVGGGDDGNVPAHSIVSLQQSLAFITGVDNPFSADGGCDMEDVEAAKARAPFMLKARNRAVTIEDFEWLAMEASTSVARVKCLPSTAREGEVTVIVVPKAPLDADLDEKPMPTSELLKRVRHYLNERKLVSTIVNVVRPAYREISIEVEIVKLTTAPGDRVKRNIERALRRFLHPLLGGRTKTGWAFGRDILKVDLYHVIEEVDGVDFVDKIRLFDEERSLEVELLRLGDDELVHVVNVNVLEKAHERIL